VIEKVSLCWTREISVSPSELLEDELDENGQE
jgi:hypothetical protein